MAITNAAAAGTQGLRAPLKVQSMGRLDFDLDNSYPANAGGYASFANTAGGTIQGISAFTGVTVIEIPDKIVENAAGGTWALLHWDRANDRLMVINPATGVEFANGADLSGFTNVELSFYYI